MAKEGDSDYTMVMNPDIVVNPRIFMQLLRPFADARTGVTEARQTPLEHRKEYDKETGETSWGNTACAMIARKVFGRIGGFDGETFFLYCDDVDFSWMVRLAGYKVIYVPSAAVFHDRRVTAEACWMPTNAEVPLCVGWRREHERTESASNNRRSRRGGKAPRSVRSARMACGRLSDSGRAYFRP